MAGDLLQLQELIKRLNLVVVQVKISPVEEDDIMELCQGIETEIARIEYTVLPGLDDLEEEETQFKLWQIKNRFEALKVGYRRNIYESRAKETKHLFSQTLDKPKEEVENPSALGAAHDDSKFSLDDGTLKQLSAKESLLNTNTQLTDKLQNVSALMKSTILASELNMAELELSNSTLVHLGERYSVFGDVLKKTNSLVTQINKASKRDRVMIYRAIYFFIAVSVWILYRRLLRKPIRLVLWLVFSSIKLVLWGASSTSAKTPVEESLSASLEIVSTVATTETINLVTETLESILKDEL